ncbi:MAG TPA: c-type cytochrome biogenesis protein CcmI [Phenylobacterium sp.]|jgi:cytochrome c-type biogenesis protein CcmH|nr:c-type cytochrome biogenesis protein CcmI [Phenylobacterium sp.]
MIVFWVAAGVLSAAAAGLILSRAASAARGGEATDPTPVLYRRQLAEIDDLAERGLMGEAERRSAHAEAGRRLLAATDAPARSWTAEPNARRGVLVAVVAAPALALVIYLALGSPGMPDQPFALRMRQWLAGDPAQLSLPELAAVLQKKVAERPDDPEGYRYLALAEGRSQNTPEAIRALRRGLRIAPERADMWEMLGEALMEESNGSLTDEAKQAFRKTLQLQPNAVVARFQLARARIEAGDKAGGLADWRALQAELPPGDDRRQAIAEAIADQIGRAPPPVLAPGQSPPNIQAMVEGLAQRLKLHPDDPDGWVRLVRAYSVLGETDKRDATLRSARARYAGRPDVLGELAVAAKAEPMK